MGVCYALILVPRLGPACSPALLDLRSQPTPMGLLEHRHHTTEPLEMSARAQVCCLSPRSDLTGYACAHSIHHHHSGVQAVTDDTEGEVEVNVDDLSDATLWRLEGLLHGTNEAGAARTMAHGRTTPARDRETPSRQVRMPGVPVRVKSCR